MLHGRNIFNGEELLFLNRLSLLILSRHALTGKLITFAEFMDGVEVLQNGKYTDKVEMLV